MAQQCILELKIIDLAISLLQHATQIVQLGCEQVSLFTFTRIHTHKCTAGKRNILYILYQVQLQAKLVNNYT